jgi:hypothetical protein
MFFVSVVLWYIFMAHKRNVRKNPEKAEEENKRRIAQGKPPLTVEDLRRVIAEENIIISVKFGLAAAVLYTLIIAGIEIFIVR